MIQFRIFLGSSSESQHMVQKLEHFIKTINFTSEIQVIPRLWYKPGVFGLGDITIQTLEDEVSNSDFAIFVLSDDDRLNFRHQDYMCPRDNVVFEAGFFMSRLGRERTVLVLPDSKYRGFDIPHKELTDLKGVTYLYCDLRNLPSGFPKDFSDRLELSLKTAAEAIKDKTEATNQAQVNLSSDTFYIPKTLR